MLEINFSKQAEKFLKTLQKKDRDFAKQITLKILALKINPKPLTSKAIFNNTSFRRIRIGKFRVIYRFDDKVIFITVIDKRDEIYNNFN